MLKARNGNDGLRSKGGGTWKSVWRLKTPKRRISLKKQKKKGGKGS